MSGLYKKHNALTKSKMINLRDINSSELKKVVSNIHTVYTNRNTSVHVVNQNMIDIYLKRILIQVHTMMLLISNKTQLLHTEIVMVVHDLQKKSNHTFFSWMDVVLVANVAQQKYPRVPYMDSIDFLTTKRIDGT